VADVRAIADGYVGALTEILRDADLGALGQLVEEIQRTRGRGGTTFIIGNGGSASTASHWAHDLGRCAANDGDEPLRAQALTDDSAQITAVANDHGYEHVFALRLAQLARPGDLLVAISASGNSPNLIRAVECAGERGVVTAAMVGFDGGALKDVVDLCLWVPTELGAYGPTESAHSVLCDVVNECIAGRLPRPALSADV
jgi:D-sedoheptulose 7-phosphate isomerase